MARGLNDNPEHDRQNDHHQNVLDERTGIDRHPAAGQQADQRGCSQRCDNGRHGSDGYPQRNIPFRQQRHHIGRGAARAASDEDDAYGDIRRQV
ncbi:hypothetical protein BGX30_012610 [Mortierella sp. GBA39]|nr:hypothetical protein BGX30_012610 [Mortierella sp. GBA39]